MEKSEPFDNKWCGYFQISGVLGILPDKPSATAEWYILIFPFPMNYLRGLPVVILLVISCISCNKNTCPDYYQHPDCIVESRTRFYGMYKGISCKGDDTVITQWAAGPGNAVDEINIAANMVLELDPRDTRVFTFKEGSFIDGNFYIRYEKFAGRFTDDSLYFDVWLDEGLGQTPGKKRIRYTFAGKKK